jgi:predicted transcriptional regulator/transcriptional regulator with XRE-family HTH domain
MEEEYIKLIFGLKLRQIRTERKLSLSGLSRLSGMSKSYLNEIEKGKKYPKPDKIAILSEKLEVPFDQMVSLKLDKNLAPIGKLLQSKVLKEIPLDLFGIEENKLIDIVANAPAKVNAFISTIIEIAQNYNFSRENFFLASVRSLQEANNNYFDNIEQQVQRFLKAFQKDLGQPLTSKALEGILEGTYGYTINEKELSKYQALERLRAVYVPKTKTLLLSNTLDEEQRCFIYAKEIAYNFLKIKDRLYTFSWIKFENFEQVINNFYASYFAGALIIPKDDLTKRLGILFDREVFDRELFLETMEAFNASPETFYQRLTNILPRSFNIQDLFFLRFTHQAGSGKFHLTKELHLSHQQSPRANENNEHYCRRWVSLKVLQDISWNGKDHEFDLQISTYADGKRYLVLSSATKDPFRHNQYRSITLGLLINRHLERRLKFLKDEAIKSVGVGVTCERCAIKDCMVRQKSPLFLESEAKNKKIDQIVQELGERFG